MNHHGLFIKLMNRCLPVALLSVLENWFSRCFSFVKWIGSHSYSFSLTCVIRQGGVLSPYLFAIYIDDLTRDIMKLSIGCVSHFVPVCIDTYADDILLLVPSVSALQRLVCACE